jgi:hypothetical protein
LGAGWVLEFARNVAVDVYACLIEVVSRNVPVNCSIKTCKKSPVKGEKKGL